MALKIFLFLLILTPFLLINDHIVEDSKTNVTNEIPKVSFINATMYEITDKNIDKMLYTKKLNKYENKEELYHSKLILRNANNNSDTIIAEYMKKENNIYVFQKNVMLNRDGDLELKTDSLEYDIKNGIASNQVDFWFKYKNSTFSGKNLYLNRNDYSISGDNAHFVINKKDL